jgi:hypothetical protein
MDGYEKDKERKAYWSKKDGQRFVITLLNIFTTL